MNIAQGRQVVAATGTPVALSATNKPVARLIIAAITTNTNPVVVGGTGVIAAVGTRTGIPVQPVATGESQVEFCNVDLKDVYIDAVTNGEGITYTYFF